MHQQPHQQSSTSHSGEYYNPVSDEEEIVPATTLSNSHHQQQQHHHHQNETLTSAAAAQAQAQAQTQVPQVPPRRKEIEDDDDDLRDDDDEVPHTQPSATARYYNSSHHHNQQQQQQSPPLPQVTRSAAVHPPAGGGYHYQQQQHQHQHQQQVQSTAVLPPPTVGGSETNYIPYKYTVDETKGIFRIFTRSTCGQIRKVFTMDVQSWSYLDIPTGHTNPARTVSILCEEMSTDRVSYDPSTGHFIVEPSEAVTQKVREAARKITRVPLTSYSVLSRFGHRFFDLLQENGRWVKKATISASSQSNPTISEGAVVGVPTAAAASSSLSSSATTRAAFQTVAWTVIDPGTISFIRSGVNCEENHPVINVWTIYSSFAGSSHTSAAVASLVSNVPESTAIIAPSLDITVRVFGSQKEIITEFYNFLRSEVDIAVHYGETDSPIASSLRKYLLSDSQEGIAKIATGTLELFDLKDYVRNVYTDMPSHDFKTVITHINIYSSSSSPEENKNIPLSENTVNHLTVAAATSLTGGSSGDVGFGSPNSEFFLPDLKTTIHSHENIAFFLEKIAAKTFLLSRLYTKLSKSIFDLVFLSGCNITSLTSREMTSRGVVAFIDPIAAWSQIVDTLPYDYMKPGIHSLTHVTPLSNILVDNMCKSDHLLTSAIGKKIQSLKTYGWIIREIYSMRSLSPLPLPDIPSVFGIFKGMVYSTEEIPGYEVAREWSSIINVGLSSWIGISMIANEPDGSEERNGFGGGTVASAAAAPPSISFGYFGIEDVCRHPFDAMRTAVEMFLSLSIYSNTPASAKTVALSTVLTPENMTVRRKITAANLSTFSSLLPPTEVSQISEGTSETVLKLWYKSNDKFTTNPLLADRKVYVGMLENMLTQTFGFLQTTPSSASAASAASAAAQMTSQMTSRGGGVGEKHHHHHHPVRSTAGNPHHHQSSSSLALEGGGSGSGSSRNPLNPNFPLNSSSSMHLPPPPSHHPPNLHHQQKREILPPNASSCLNSQPLIENVQTVKVQADRDRVFPGLLYSR